MRGGREEEEGEVGDAVVWGINVAEMIGREEKGEEKL